MRDQTYLRRLCMRALNGDREVDDFIDTSRLRWVHEAEGLLDMLAEVAGAPGKHSDDGIMVFVGLLEYSRGAALKLVLRKGLPLLDKLAVRLPSQSWAWAQALHAMAYWAIRGSRRSLHCWCRHFLAVDPGRETEIYELAVAPLSDEKATCTRYLFPELLRALACPPKRLAVVQVANAAFAHDHLPTHPLSNELEVLAEMLTGDGNTRASVDGAVAACGALDMIGSSDAGALMTKALASPHPGNSFTRGELAGTGRQRAGTRRAGGGHFGSADDLPGPVLLAHVGPR